MTASARSVPELLAPDEPPPYELVGEGRQRPLIFVCDHAANRVPRALGTLGLEARHFDDHIAWDIGAAGVTRRLLERFEASGVIASYSRLVVDLNRGLHHASAFPELSDGVLVPANLGLGAADREARAASLYRPYHAAVRALIGARTTAAVAPVFVAIHSFTPRQHGTSRPWHIGVLWDKDPRLPVALLQSLRARGDVAVADNEPYSGRHWADYTIDHHAEPLGLAHASVEIRQDLIRDEAGQARWAERLGDALAGVLEAPELYDPARSWLGARAP